MKRDRLSKESFWNLPDAVIAASALSLNAILITRNEKDFDGVSGLVVYNPFSK